MGIVYTPESGYSLERAKFEAQHTAFGPPGRPYVFQPYPTRMYRAGRNDKGKTAILQAETARDDHEREQFERLGCVVGGQQAAMDAYEAQEAEYAQLAAERNYAEMRMSAKAQAEGQAVNEAAGARHVPVVEETPIPSHARKGWPKGKPRKAVASVE